MIAFIPTLQAAPRLRSGTARAVAVLWLVVSSLAAAFPGAPDATFGSGFGTVITPIGSGTDVAYSLALQPDGMILVAGTCSNGTDYDFVSPVTSPTALSTRTLTASAKSSRR